MNCPSCLRGSGSGRAGPCPAGRVQGGRVSELLTIGEFSARCWLPAGVLRLRS